MGAEGTCCPVPELDGAVVPPRHEHAVLVDGQAVHDRLVAPEVVHEVALGALPLLDVVRGAAREGVLHGVQGDAPHPLLVVGQGLQGLP